MCTDQAFERTEANLRPRLQRLAARHQFIFAEKCDIRDHRFAFLHIWLGQFENVDNAEVNLADFGAVVID